MGSTGKGKDITEADHEAGLGDAAGRCLVGVGVISAYRLANDPNLFTADGQRHCLLLGDDVLAQPSEAGFDLLGAT